MEAILLVGGFGTRLMPLTADTPKPMLKVAGVPFIAHQIGYAKAHGITRIVIATSYKTEQFLEYLGDGSRFGVEIAYAIEEEPLGTGGAIANAATFLKSEADQPVAILNGDVLSAHDISAQIAHHQQVGADATLHLIEVDDARAYGSVPTDGAGRILEFLEKSENPPTRFINAGCYIFTRAVINRIPQGRVVSVERETFPTLLAEGLILWGFMGGDYWIDIGTPAALRKASIDLVTGAFRSPVFTPRADHIFVDSRAEIDPSASLNAGCAIGASILKSDTVIDVSIIGDDVLIESGAQISHSIIGNGVRIGQGAIVEQSVIGGPGEFLQPNSRHIGGI